MGTDIHGIMQAKGDDGWFDIPHKFDMSRHYTLFAWLGNVRNGFGFAGCKMSDEVKPLSDCRGFPDDFEVVGGDSHPIASRELAEKWLQDNWDDDEEVEGYWMGDHSYSYVTSEEVLECQLGSLRKTGIVSIEGFDNIGADGKPESWCGGVSGNGINVLDCGDKPIQDIKSSIETHHTHVRIYWDQDLTEEFSYSVDEIKRLSDKYGQVRFVFGFDS